MLELPDTTRRGGSRTSLEDRRGFALPAVLLLLMVLSTVTVFFLISSSDQQRAGRAMKESAHSFYAADAGVNVVLAQWDSLQYDTLVAAPGDSVDLGWVTLDGGATYRAKIYRVDASQGTPFYSLAVTGVGPPPFGGQRTIYVELYGVDVCCSSPVMGGGDPGADLKLDELSLGGVTVNGNDSIPSGWDALCTNPLVDQPGIMWADTVLLTIEPTSVVLGDPEFVEDTTITTASLFDWGSVDYDDLAAMADIVFPDGTTLAGTDIGPVEAPPGTCKVSGVGSQLNWGDPLNPTSPCGSYFPIIHIPGTFRIELGPGYGQGILLVDGQLTIENSFDFYGIIMTGVKDPLRARLEDSVTVHGAIISNDELRIESGARLQYSSCAIKRVLERAGIKGEVKPLPKRSWRQVMD